MDEFVNKALVNEECLKVIEKSLDTLRGEPSLADMLKICVLAESELVGDWKQLRRYLVNAYRSTKRGESR